MDVSLSAQNEKLIKEKIKSGEYGSPEDVVDAALRLLDEHDKKLAALRKDVQIGIDQLERGEYTEYTDETLHELFDKVTRRGLERLESNKAKQSD